MKIIFVGKDDKPIVTSPDLIVVVQKDTGMPLHKSKIKRRYGGSSNWYSSSRRV